MTDHTTSEQKAREMLERPDILTRLNQSSANESSHELQCRCFDATEEIQRMRTELVRYASLEHENKRALDKYNSELRVENAALRESNERLREELENEQARGIHSCHPNCTRDGCVNRRLRGMLSEALDQFEDYGDHGFWRVPASLMGRIREELGDE